MTALRKSRLAKPAFKPIAVDDPKAVDTLAAMFIGTLGRWLTDASYAEFCRRTREDFSEQFCHSHDYCDANMAMDEAFNLVFGRSPETDSEADMALFNSAWDRAKRFIGKGE